MFFIVFMRARKIAHSIYEQVAEIEEVYIWLQSQIGQAIDQPAIAAAQVVMKPGTSFQHAQKEIEKVINTELENIDKFCTDLAHGRISIV